MKTQRAAFFTLLEVIIALGLVALLITTLFGIYYQIDASQRANALSRKESFERFYVQYRFSQVFSHVIPKKKDSGREKPYFYTLVEDRKGFPNTSLILTYDNGANFPSFTTDVIGRIYLDPEGQLCLLTWPTPDQFPGFNPPMHKEVLLTGVEKIEFSFFLAPFFSSAKETAGKEKARPDPIQLKNYGAWHPHWPVEGIGPDKITIPPMVKVLLWMKKSSSRSEKVPDLTLAFVIPGADQTIVYSDAEAGL